MRMTFLVQTDPDQYGIIARPAAPSSITVDGEVALTGDHLREGLKCRNVAFNLLKRIPRSNPRMVHRFFW